jgi:hypothetical protein
MPEDEARRRIREAKETGAVELDLSQLALHRLPRELARLTSLKWLNLYGCSRLSGDISPLAGLTSLQWLNLEGCRRLSAVAGEIAHHDKFAPCYRNAPELPANKCPHGQFQRHCECYAGVTEQEVSDALQELLANRKPSRIKS